uniref:Uncharacterized protein n=1 Tax=Caenorhabditis japonica TaxID=281687 RepID=A0A8R1EUD0_CAEJA
VIRKVFEILHHSVLRPSRVIDKIFLNLNSELMEGRIVFQSARPCSIYEIVISRAMKLDTKYEASAMVLLVHLCCKPYLMRHVYSDTLKSVPFQRLHHLVIDFAITMLRRPETKPKSRGLAVSIVKNLSLKNRRSKRWHSRWT